MMLKIQLCHHRNKLLYILKYIFNILNYKEYFTKNIVFLYFGSNKCLPSDSETSFKCIKNYIILGDRQEYSKLGERREGQSKIKIKNVKIKEK